MPSVTALRRWLVFVALLRLLSGEKGHDSHIDNIWGYDSTAYMSVERCQGGIGTCWMIRTALPLAMVCCAVYLGIFEVKYFRTNLFDLHPDSGTKSSQTHSTQSSPPKPSSTFGAYA